MNKPNTLFQKILDAAIEDAAEDAKIVRENKPYKITFVVKELIGAVVGNSCGIERCSFEMEYE